MLEFDPTSWEPFQALYLHVPFCAKRCAYCDFATGVPHAPREQFASYTNTICEQLEDCQHLGLLHDVQTVYLGGGTPSLLGPNHLERILQHIYAACAYDERSDYEQREWTLEANPESVTATLLDRVQAAGINRISLGVQSFQPELLTTLGRIHSKDTARNALHLITQRFDQVSLDLMCGLPGQTRQQWRDDLYTALDTQVSHISIYPLSIEEGTPLHEAICVGRYSYPDEDLQADMMEDACDILTQAGFERYEVASYARPGRESAHNSAYWTGKPYLGLGTGAVSMRQNSSQRERFSIVFLNRVYRPRAGLCRRPTPWYASGCGCVC